MRNTYLIKVVLGKDGSKYFWLDNNHDFLLYDLWIDLLKQNPNYYLRYRAKKHSNTNRLKKTINLLYKRHYWKIVYTNYFPI